MYQFTVLVTGLAFFLFGMGQLSSMLSNFTGGGFAGKISRYTGNDFMKVLTGFLITTLFQSSGATTAILVSMTSVGLVTVLQSVSFLIGANIGSITTAWIVAVKITKAGIFMFAAGVAGNFIFKKDILVVMSRFLIGLGLIFFGLETMSGTFSFIRDNPALIGFMTEYDAAVSVPSMLLLTLTGFIFTALIHSSGATAAMVIAAVISGILSFHSGAAIVLGSTLGSTFTAVLASIGTSAEGKRTAFLQVFMNVMEMTAGLMIFYPMTGFVVTLSEKIDFPNTGFRIALYMTLLKVILALMVFPLRKQLSGLAEKIIRKRFRLITAPLVVPVIGSEDTEQSLRDKLMPVTDIYADYLRDMLAYSYIGIRKPSLRSLYQKVTRYESVIDSGHQNMVAAISHCKNDNEHILWLFLKMSDEAESMGDHAKEIAKYGVRLDEIKHRLSERQKKILLECYLMVFRQFHEVCIKKHYSCELITKCEETERHLRREKRLIYSLLCKEQDHDYEKRLILVDILSEYSKFNHSVKRIAQVNLDVNEGRGIFLWEPKGDRL